MADFAKVDAVDALVDFQPHVLEMARTIRTSLDEAISAARQTQAWLENEQKSFWRREIARRQELLRKACDAYQEKKNNKTVISANHSGVEERQLMRKAERKLEEAMRRQQACKVQAIELQQAIDLFMGHISSLSLMGSHDLLCAVQELQHDVAQLKAYMQVDTDMPEEFQIPPSDTSRSDA